MLHEKKNIMRNFNQKLYTFSLKLKLYFSDKALNYMSFHHDHIINLVNIINVASYNL